MGAYTGGGVGKIVKDWGFNSMLEDEQRSMSEKGTRLAGAKKTGAGIGGLLGALALTVLTGGAAAPLLLAAAGGAGALLGSKIGGKASGVSQNDILGGEYMKGTRGRITKDIAKDEFGNVAKAAASSFMNAGGLNKAGGSIVDFGKNVKTYGLGETVKGYGKNILGKSGDISKVLAGGEGAPGIQDIVSKLGGEAGGGVASAATGGGVTGGGGFLSKLKGGYGGVDKFLGGVMPGGEKLSMESMGGAFGGMPGGAGNLLKGLLGQQQGGPTQNPIGVDDTATSIEPADHMSNIANIMGSGDNPLSGIGGGPQNPFEGDSDSLLEFQKHFNTMGMGSPIAEDGQWGQQSSEAYKLFNQYSGGQ